MQTTHETSANIPRYCNLVICTMVNRARASRKSVTLSRKKFFFLEILSLLLSEWENKFLKICFGVLHYGIFFLVVCIFTRPTGSSKYSTTRKNTLRQYTPKHLIRYIYFTNVYFVAKGCLSLFCIEYPFYTLDKLLIVFSL